VRVPETITYAYLDFDSFYASVEQQRRPELRGRPVGITPSNTQMGGTIAVSREAKRLGISRVGGRKDALKICPDMAFVAQDPEHYMRVHHAALKAIDSVVPVHDIRSVDELGIRLSPAESREPEWLSARIKGALAESIGPYISASIGFSTNRVLAKIAGALEKPDGCTVWQPADTPAHLATIPLKDVPGIGERMLIRLQRNGITTIPGLLAISPKRARAIWGSVLGERMWQYLHGYEVEEPPTQKSMIGHGRVLPRYWQGFDQPYLTARLLTIKAARRMRRWGYCAGSFYLGLKFRDPDNDRNVYTRDDRGRETFHRWGAETEMHFANDDHAGLAALDRLWTQVRKVPPNTRDGGRWDHINVAHVQITFAGLRLLSGRQSDLFADDRPDAQKWRRVTTAVDALNTRYTASVITQGPWVPPPGGNAGGKIAFNRVPEMEDFI